MKIKKIGVFVLSLALTMSMVLMAPIMVYGVENIEQEELSYLEDEELIVLSEDADSETDNETEIIVDEAAADNVVETEAYADYADTTVAVIGGNEYNSLQAAFDAVDDNDTIVLVKDITYTEGIHNTINSGKTFTIDFNDKKISINYMGLPFNNDCITVSGNSNVTVNNAKFTYGMLNAGGSGFVVKSGSSLNLKGGNFSGNNYPVTNDGGTVIIDGGTYGVKSGALLGYSMLRHLAGNSTMKGNINTCLSNSVIAVGDGTNADPRFRCRNCHNSRRIFFYNIFYSICAF